MIYYEVKGCFFFKCVERMFCMRISSLVDVYSIQVELRTEERVRLSLGFKLFGKCNF